MPNLKPALSYPKQVERLREVHNLSISDDEAAIRILQKVNYYRLSGYGIGLKQKDNERYRDEITLEWLFSLYCFDSQFKNNVIHIVEQIEIQLRTQIAHHLAMKYGPTGYLSKENFEGKTDKFGKTYYQKTIESFRKEVDRRDSVPFVRHHIDKYDGVFPVWVAVELFSFGMLSTLFDIMKQEDQSCVAKQYNNAKAKHLKSWILALLEIRNICAHYTRLYNLPLKQSPHLYKENVQYRQGRRNKVFPVLLVIKRMLNSNAQWQSFRRDIEATISKFERFINFSYMGFPQNWRAVLSADEAPLNDL